MKKLFTALTIAISLTASAQKSEVIAVDSATKADLYSKSMEWVAKTWSKANEVVQSKDPEAGVIIVKGGLASKPKSLGMPVAGMTYTTVTIRVKDGKAKIDFEDTFFRHSMGTVNFTDKSADTCIYKKWKAAVDEEQIGMIADLKLALTKKLEDF